MRLLLAAAVVLLAGSAFAQDGNERAVLAANEAFGKVIGTRDADLIGKTWAHESYVIAINTDSTAPAIGWESVRKSFEDMTDRWVGLSITMKEPRVFIRGDLAWVIGVETAKGQRKNGETVEFSAITTNVFEKQGTSWLLIHHQATPVGAAQN